MPVSVPGSSSVSRSSLHGSRHVAPTRAVDSVDLATQAHALGIGMPKCRRGDDYVYLIYEYTQMDGSYHGQNMVVQSHLPHYAKGPIGLVLKEYYGIPNHMLTATHY